MSPRSARPRLHPPHRRDLERAGWFAGALLTLAACAAPSDDVARQAELVNVFTRSDQALIVNRPELAAGKFWLMADADAAGKGTRFAYHRANVPMFLQDWRNDTGILSRSNFHLSAPLVLSTGDPHPENYGVMIADDGTLALEPNDFDGADMLPFLWDVRRLTVGAVIAAYVANDDNRNGVVDADEAPRWQPTVAAAASIAQAAVEGYVDGLREQAESATANFRLTPTELAARGGAGLIAVAFEDAQAELAKTGSARTELVQYSDCVLLGDPTGKAQDCKNVKAPYFRRLKRGVVSDQRTDVTASLPENILAELPHTLKRYAASLEPSVLATRPASFFTLKDAVRVFGKGVASWPKIRLYVLIDGPTTGPDDDVLLELREIGDSGLSGWYAPVVHFNSPEQRVLQTTRAAWARRDAAPLWGTSTLAGLPVQLKLEAEAQGTLRTRNMVGADGTAAEISKVVRLLGRVQARIHSTPSPLDPAPARTLWAKISGDRAAFIAEQVDVGVRYGAQVLRDQQLFKGARAALGATLGLTPRPEEQPPADLRAFIGDPAAPCLPTLPAGFPASRCAPWRLSEN